MHLLAVSNVLIPSLSIGELISPDWPRLPVATTLPLRQAYCYQLHPGDELLLERESPARATDLLIVRAPDEPIEFDPMEWKGSWVVFLEGTGARARLGHLDSQRRIRAPGEANARFQVGPDDYFSPPKKRSSMKYGVGIDGITNIFKDYVVGEVIARLVWQDEYLVPVPIAKLDGSEAKTKGKKT